MNSVNLHEARQSLSRLIERVQAGEKIVILRRGQPVARLVQLAPASVAFRSRAALRKALPPMRQSAATSVRQWCNAEDS